jgi:histidinol-phosphate aminotransferase
MNGLILNSQLLQVPLYVAGKSAEQVSKELELDGVVKLCSNENPLGPSPMALAALQEVLREAHRYPGMAEYQLQQKLAVYHGGDLTPSHFIIGNGATDVLRAVAQSFIFDGGESVMCRVAFPLYSLLTTMYGGRSIRVEPRRDYHLDLPLMADAITDDTRIVWLCSPNNPTGFVLSQAEVDEFMDWVPDHVVVVFDEAYCDFITDPDHADSVRYVREGRNAITVRSFSKSAGLANLRVGYGIASPEIIEYLLHVVLPFSTGATAVTAAAASLDDDEFHRRSRELVQQERTYLYTRLSGMGLACLPSQANFVLVIDPPLGAPVVVDALLHQGVVVRPMTGFGLPNALRVTVGLPEQNERFLAAMRVVLAGALVVPI